MDFKSENEANLVIQEAMMKIIGVVHFDNIVRLRAQGEKFLQKCSALECKIDLQNITGRDASSLALLLAWQREAKRLNKTLLFTHVPEPLQRVAAVCKVGALLWTN